MSLWEKEKGTGGKLLILKAYVQIAEGLVGGALLSQIVYWHRPNASGESKLKVKRHDRFWIAKDQKTWCEECFISPAQFGRARRKLQSIGLIEVRSMMFHGCKVLHIALNMAELESLVDQQLHQSELAESI
ncbi:hypothetical protein [Roseateles sp. PN1]|uniref:hypothetical protein n=1 Tax=Roseateles sp. PN1 TaxID=3137372 RepID=UPI0031398A74